jgi:hypothetical protein
MYPKDDIQKLNRRRELNRRLSFVKKRMTEVGVELHFARGDIQSLPKEMVEPPEWALKAARWVATNCLGIPSKEEISKDIGGAWEEMIGRYDGILAFITGVGTEKTDDVEVRRVLRKLQKFTLEIADKNTLDKIKERDLAVERLLPPMTPEELFELGERRRRGISSVVNRKGELQILKSTQAEIYYFVWFFWPVLREMIPTLTAAKVSAWLSKEFGIFTSMETVEIVYTKLDLASFKKDKPKGP